MNQPTKPGQSQGLSILFATIGLIGATSVPVQAQSIVPAADGTNTQVTQDGQRYIIDGGSFSSDGKNQFHSFQEFGLNANQIADFLANPDLLNILGRVTGGSASIIDGLIQVTDGNPNLYLTNPAGFVFNSNASLNVPAAFTATTANRIGFGNDQWFNAAGPNSFSSLTGRPNQFAFTASQPGSIFNAGDLAVAEGQSLMLLGGSVLNTGTLSAPGGDIMVAAVPGESLVRISQENMLLNLEVESLPAAAHSPHPPHPTPQSLPELLTQANLDHSSGVTINADGTVQLTGSGLTLPPDPGTTIISGHLSASTSQPKPGGSITILGDQIGLFDALVEASGPAGGGDIRIGGEFQGSGTLHRASHTAIDQGSNIIANALKNGDGGRVIVWADELTRFYGNVAARGGPQAGDGGFVEVSGKELLVFVGEVDAGTTQGDPGTLLLDPKNVTIDDSTSSLATIFNPNASGGSFGLSVAAAGNDLLIGAQGNTSGGVFVVGQAFLFDRDGTLLKTFENPNPVAFGRFGLSVAAAGDDFLIGAPGNFSGGVSRAGQAFLFNRSGTLLQTFDTPTPFAGGSFGQSVEFSSNDLLIGAPFNDSGGVSRAGQAFLFNRSGTLLQTFNNQNPVFEGRFGESLETVGNDFLIGAPFNDSGGVSRAGQAFLFNRSGNLLATFNNPNSSFGSRFGTSLASADDNILIGAPFNNFGEISGAGQAFLFDRSGTLLQTFDNPNPDPVFQSSFGDSVAFADKRILIGAPRNTSGGVAASGQAFLFESGGTLLQTFDNPNPNPDNSNRFSESLTVINNEILIGTPNNIGGGQAFLFPGAGNFSNLTSGTSSSESIASGTSGFSNFAAQDFTVAASTLTNLANLGTNVIVQANNDITVNRAITSSNPNGNGGSLTLQAGRSLFINANLSTDNGDLTLIGNETAANGTVMDFRDAGAATITTAAGVTLDAGTGTLTAILRSGEARGDISLGNIVAGGVQIQNEGSDGGGVTVGDVTTNGGDISILAQTSVTAGFLDTSSATSDGGDVFIDPIGDVQFVAINAQGGTNGVGGDVDITAGQSIRGTSTFVDRNGVLATISTAGGQGGGSITLRHGGNGVTPFIVGDAATNGLAGAITNGEFTISSGTFFGTHILDTISIITNDTSALNGTCAADCVEEEDPLMDTDSRRILQPLALEDAVFKVEELFTTEFANYFGLGTVNIKTLKEIKQELADIDKRTGMKNALIYAFFAPAVAVPDRQETASLGKLLDAQTRDDLEEELHIFYPERGADRSAVLIGQERWQAEAAIQARRERIERERNRSDGAGQQSYLPEADDRLYLIMVTADEGESTYKPRQESSYREVDQIVKQLLHREIDSDSLPAAGQTLHQKLIGPLQDDLRKRQVENLIFIMDVGLRSVPVAALHDGQHFLIQDKDPENLGYSVAKMPSYSLIDTRYRGKLQGGRLLPMGISNFEHLEQSLNNLEAVPHELDAITQVPWQGQALLNEAATKDAFTRQLDRKIFEVVHVATHADFGSGAAETSYIQFWNDRLSLKEIAEQRPGKVVPIELLTLSACQTAVGDPNAEFGFAGFATQRSGIKAALASLWKVDDLHAMALMTEFYRQLQRDEVRTKSEALRFAQLALLRAIAHNGPPTSLPLSNPDAIAYNGPQGLLKLSNQDVVKAPESSEFQNFMLPSNWSAFTLVGNPW